VEISLSDLSPYQAETVIRYVKEGELIQSMQDKFSSHSFDVLSQTYAGPRLPEPDFGGPGIVLDADV